MEISKKIITVTVVAFIILSSVLFIFFKVKQDAKGLISGEKPEMDKLKYNETRTATFSLGCFWGPDSKFGAIPGVVRTRVGYSGGSSDDPSYYLLGDHTETVQIDYDPDKISYEELLNIFWASHDPTILKKTQYRSMIFYHEGQEDKARNSKMYEQLNYNDTIKTKIRPFSEFFRAEDYHQKYHLRQDKLLFNAFKHIYSNTKDLVDSTAVTRANGYINGQGMIDTQEDLDGMGLNEKGKERLYDRWKAAGNKNRRDYNELPRFEDMKDFVKPSDKELKEMLTPLQYKVTQKKGTEPAFNNKYWDNKKEGIYVDIVSGEVLFSSTDKFQSGSGWPSFTKPLEPDNIVTEKESGMFDNRIEVRSKHADSHLGHVFDDGPAPTGKRYCMNSAALRFVPKDEMKEEGYGEYLYLFE